MCNLCELDWLATNSELVEGEDVDGLDVVLELLDLLLNDIGGDLVVLDDGSHDELEDTEGDGLLLVLSLPDEAVHGDSENHLGELVEVGLLIPWLDFPKDDGLGDGSSLLLLGGSLLTLLLESLSSGGVSLGILSEWVEIIIVGSGGLLLLLLGFATLSTFLAL